MEGGGNAPESCIEEETLAAFAEGRLDGAKLPPIEAHLADCSECCAVFTRAAGAMSPFVAMSQGSSRTETEAGDLIAGSRVGRYVVRALVGRGAMGTVYAADDPDLDRKVALKLLHAGALSDSARGRLRTALLREAQAMARLSHPEVITVYDVGTFGDELFVAMEFVDGETLRRWRAACHRSCPEILAVYERAGSGLAAAHEAGLVHRDFKPDNVLVGRDGRVRVTDFGLARSTNPMQVTAALAVADSDGEPRKLTTTFTRSGALLGTPAYMAPEQLRGESADARSDVFSFCVALYEALYGERPFAGQNVPELRQALARGEVRAAPIMTRVPSWVRSVLLNGLRTSPAERYSSMRALLDALRAAHAATRRRKAMIAVIAGTLGIFATAAIVERGSPGIAGNEEHPAHPPVIADGPRSSISLSLGGTDVPPRQPLGPETIDANALPVTPVALTTSSRSSIKPRAPRALPSASAGPAGERPMVGNNGALILE
jgi:serine/threonine protein kinase